MTKTIELDLVTDVIFDHYGETEISAYLRSPHPLTNDGTIAGCPEGRAITPDRALKDLQRRIQSENDVRVVWLKP